MPHSDCLSHFNPEPETWFVVPRTQVLVPSEQSLKERRLRAKKEAEERASRPLEYAEAVEGL